MLKDDYFTNQKGQISPSPILESLRFKALSQRNYRWAVALIIAAIIVPAAAFMAFVIHYDITDLSRGQVISFLAVGGVISFFIVALIFSKLLAAYFTMTFHSDYMVVYSTNKVAQFDLPDIKHFEVWNNSDYSKLIFRYGDQEIKYHVGFANLLKATNILEVEDKLDIVFSPQRGFTKHIANQKGICKITYTAD